jgi:chemotaxis response regulator CheB
VVIVGDGTVLSAGVERLLRASPRIELKAIRRDGAAVFDCIRRAQPQVIVVPSIGASAATQVSIEELLREYPSACVVALRFEQSSIDVYRAERVEYATVTGFISAIEEAGEERETSTPTSDVMPGGAPGATSEGR